MTLNFVADRISKFAILENSITDKNTTLLI